MGKNDNREECGGCDESNLGSLAGLSVYLHPRSNYKSSSSSSSDKLYNTNSSGNSRRSGSRKSGSNVVASGRSSLRRVRRSNNGGHNNNRRGGRPKSEIIWPIAALVLLGFTAIHLHYSEYYQSTPDEIAIAAAANNNNRRQLRTHIDEKEFNDYQSESKQYAPFYFANSKSMEKFFNKVERQKEREDERKAHRRMQAKVLSNELLSDSKLRADFDLPSSSSVVAGLPKEENDEVMKETESTNKEVVGSSSPRNLQQEAEEASDNHVPNEIFDMILNLDNLEDLHEASDKVIRRTQREDERKAERQVVNKQERAKDRLDRLNKEIVKNRKLRAIQELDAVPPNPDGEEAGSPRQLQAVDGGVQQQEQGGIQGQGQEPTEEQRQRRAERVQREINQRRAQQEEGGPLPPESQAMAELGNMFQNLDNLNDLRPASEKLQRRVQREDGRRDKRLQINRAVRREDRQARLAFKQAKESVGMMNNNRQLSSLDILALDNIVESDKSSSSVARQLSVVIPEESSVKFSYSSDPAICINPTEVAELADMLRTLYEDHNVRAFPRNGFLLGVIRHGGFSPNESIPDSEIGILSTDVESYRKKADNNNASVVQVGEYRLALKETEKNWATWKGIVPGTTSKSSSLTEETIEQEQHYPFLGVRIKKAPYSIRAQSFYPYVMEGNYNKEKASWPYFFPRLNRADDNFDSHMKEMLNYNTEGGNHRLLDTDELLTQESVKGDPQQIGTVFKNVDFDCMVQKPFYFTTLYVPCEYDEILTAFYGTNWNHHVESRADGEQGGPKPLCKDDVVAENKILDYQTLVGPETEGEGLTTVQ